MLVAPDCDTRLLSCFYLPPPLPPGASHSADPRLLRL